MLPATEELALLVVLAARPEPQHPSWRIVELVRHRFAHRAREIALRELPGGAQGALLDSMVGADALPADVCQRLLHAAAGNPFYLEALVGSLIDAGALVPTSSGWRFDHDSPLELPETIERVIVTRIDRLPEHCRTVLTAAAVLGRAFDADQLAAVVSGEEDLQGPLTELMRLDLLREVRRWPRPQFRFKHVLIQQAAYGLLLPARRRELHARAAETLEGLGARGETESYGGLARHWHEAGDPVRALHYHRLAAAEATRVFALETALSHYNAGLGLVVGGQDRERAELLVGRGSLRWWHLGDAEGAAQDLRAALAAARSRHDRVAELRALEELGLVAAFSHATGADPPSCFDQALSIARELRDHAGEVRLLNRLAIDLTNRLRFAEGLATAKRALAAAREGGDDERLTATALDAVKTVAFHLGDLTTLRRVTGELINLHRENEELWYLQFALAEAALEPAARGRWEDARAQLDEALATNQRIAVRTDEPLFLALIAGLDRSHGAYQDALATSRRAVKRARKVGHVWWLSWSQIELATTLLDVRSPGPAIALLEGARATAERSGARTLQLRAAGHLTWAAWREDEPELADQCLEEMSDLLAGASFPPGAAPLFAAGAMVSAARVRLARDETRAVIPLLGPSLEAARRNGWLEPLAATALLTARAWRELGAADEARARAAEAVTAAEAGRHPNLLWEALALTSGLLRAEGDSAAADLARWRARELVRELADDLAEEPLRRIYAACALEEVERLARPS